MDLDKHILVIEENDIVLTDKEFKLLRYLMKNQGIVLSREKILDTLWGYDYYGDGRAVDTYIKRLRKQIGENILIIFKPLLKQDICGKEKNHEEDKK